MAGTKAGGMKAAATNKKKYGKDFYKRIGSKGGKTVIRVVLRQTQSWPKLLVPKVGQNHGVDLLERRCLGNETTE